MPTPEHRRYFALRAVEVRELAAGAGDDDSRQLLESMAASYDKLVEEADRIAFMRKSLPD